MKKIILLGAFALLSTLFSCTADEYETETKTEIKKNIKPLAPSYADDGPGDSYPPPPPPPTDE
ncbi:hypothetical protein GKZ90_0017065 [Flavobacterium sp. MC2016-06]|uniref:hypothetical protein n=1 Tax=Flavobacterium sp. MC2016-06 TaxID=2676308 RepID=UPI0012BA6462|nr:hypothetical protein [Flavobacterium sp. MC2016-06]MBU3861670.1 hypothetical protein [Flavobacterium sp. MC2016-06]